MKSRSLISAGMLAGCLVCLAIQLMGLYSWQDPTLLNIGPDDAPAPMNTVTTFASTSTTQHTTTTRVKDWFDPLEHAYGSRQCFYAEDVCYSTNQLFYRSDSTKHQPAFTLQLYSIKTRQRHASYHSNYSSYHKTKTETASLGCITSNTINHMILHAYYNDMLGEFYSRSLLGLYKYLRVERIDLTSFLQHTRLYIHRMEFTKPLMNSHSIFTDAFRSNAPLGDLVELLDSAACGCLPRVLFCGYQQVESVDGTILVPARGWMEDVQSHMRLRDPGYKGLRNLLRRRLVDDNPLVQSQISQYRHELLAEYNNKKNSNTEIAASVNDMNDSLADWKLIGLTQRSGRRQWRNLDQVMKQLSGPLLKHRIALVEINVEGDEWTPLQHLIRHAALDGLIGIHGAQLTEAIWMKPGSVVVELLPYVPATVKRGKWTTTTNQPTPLGAIFYNTDLVHVGYKLGRESAPYCHGKDNNATTRCWEVDNPWDQRDFVVQSEQVMRILEWLVIRQPSDCAEFGQLSQPGNNLVVYNAPCAPAAAAGLNMAEEPQHFFW